MQAGCWESQYEGTLKYSKFLTGMNSKFFLARELANIFAYITVIVSLVVNFTRKNICILIHPEKSFFDSKKISLNGRNLCIATRLKKNFFGVKKFFDYLFFN